MHKTEIVSVIRQIARPAVWAVLLFTLLAPATLFGEMETPRTITESARLSASLSSSHQFKSGLDGGGDVSVSHVGLGIGREVPLSDKVGLGVRATYDREGYDFSKANGLAVQNPWNQINHLGLGLRMGYRLNDRWNLGGGPIIQYAGEDGARLGDSLMYGGIVSAAYRANSDFTIGFGAGIFYRLEETRVFPSLFVSWKITDRLRLGNSYRLGLAGPAGLELSYKWDDNWELAAGGGHRASRFRLDQSGATPGGIGENSSWQVYGRVSRKLGAALHLDLFGGIAAGGKMKLQDRGGHDINAVSYSTTPILGLNIRTAF